MTDVYARQLLLLILRAVPRMIGEEKLRSECVQAGPTCPRWPLAASTSVFSNTCLRSKTTGVVCACSEILSRKGKASFDNYLKPNRDPIEVVTPPQLRSVAVIREELRGH